MVNQSTKSKAVYTQKTTANLPIEKNLRKSRDTPLLAIIPAFDEIDKIFINQI